MQKRVLNGKAIDLREKGKGKQKRKADPVTDEEEEQMWAEKVLGSASTSLCGTYTEPAVQHTRLPGAPPTLCTRPQVCE